jgi:cytochrome c556
MRSLSVPIALLISVAALGAQTRAPAAKSAPPATPTLRVGTMSELMVHLIYPTSDAIFYISSRTPTTDAEWTTLQAQTLTLAESANLLMMPGRTRAGQWNRDARQMLDAAAAAFKGAKAKDTAAIEAVSDQLLESCTSCHKAYRPNYGKPPRGF